MKNLLFLLFVFLIYHSAFANNLSQQSLLNTWKDTNLEKCERSEAFQQIDWEKLIFIESKQNSGYTNIDSLIDSSIYINLQVLKEAKLEEDFIDSAFAFKNLGQLYLWEGKYNSSVDNYIQALHFFEQIREDLISVEIKTKLAYAYREIGDFLQAKSFAFSALRVARASNNNELTALANLSIAQIFTAENNFEYAKRYFNIVENTINSIENIALLGLFHQSIGLYFHENKAYKKAVSSQQTAFEYFEKTNNPQLISNCLILLAKSQIYLQDFLEAEKSLLISQQINTINQLEKTAALNDMVYGRLLTKKGNFSEAEKQLVKANSKIEQLGSVRLQKESHKKLYQLYDTISSTINNSQNKKYLELTLYHYKNYVELRDKIFDINSARESARRATQIRYERKMLADSLRNADIIALKKATIEAQENELALEKTRFLALIGVLILLALFAVFAYNRYLHSKKQEKIIEKERDFAKAEHQEAEKQKLIAQKEHEEAEKQKKIVELKNNEILDSINYARRIQNTILPSPKLVESYLEESFIIYKPKDIVAGDFFWMETVVASSNDINLESTSSPKKKILFAAADCTGHGVPGALVSIFCNNGLNRSVKEFGLIKPSDILDKTKEIVLQEFEKNDDNVKDGMDIALCSIEKIENDDCIKLEYAGANNPLWIISKNNNLKCNFNKKHAADDLGINNSSLYLYEISADKQPIGQHTFNTPFTHHEIYLSKGDCVYIFSDGYVDQFGGELGKKFKSSQLRKTLLSINHLNMNEQKNSLISIFNNWKSDIPQVDDVCFIGVRVS